MKFRFGAFFDKRKLPVAPARFGYTDVGRQWGMFGNDKYSNCVFVGAAHEHMLWAKSRRPLFRTEEILQDYSAVTGFDPTKPETDQGTDMQAAASYRRKTGVSDAFGTKYTVDAYVALRVGNAEDLALATYLTGATGVGLMLPPYALDQFDGIDQPGNRPVPWSTMKDAPDPMGGHYVTCVGRNSKGHFMVVTWGRLHAMTPAFFERYCDEAIAYINLDWLASGLTPAGFKADELRHNLAALAA